MGHSEICCILLMIFNLRLVRSCGQGEYSFQELCCPMCQAGARVLKHCTSELSTTCTPCARGAYTNHPNGLDKCLKCKYCDPELGLDMVRECTETQDALCDCKAEYLCLARTKDGCHICTKYIQDVFNESGIKKGVPKQHEVSPITESGITHNDTIGKVMGQDDTPLGNNTLRRKTGSKPEIAATFWKVDAEPEATTEKPNLRRAQDPARITKTLMTLIQTIDQTFPKESLKLQEAGNAAIIELQNTMQTNLAGVQSVMQIGLANIQNTIQSSMAGLQGAMKTGMADIQSALQIGMTGIQEALKSGMADVKGIKNGLTQVDNTLKQLQTSSQSNLVQMTKQIGSLVNVLTKLASNQTVSFIQLKDITCKPSNRTEAVQLQVTAKQP
uniref:uncharacterized protein isoform X1 n=2 Tax=Pristiophorus japonicus TaxID=55135 RepID=UPI00398F68E9